MHNGEVLGNEEGKHVRTDEGNEEGILDGKDEGTEIGIAFSSKDGTTEGSEELECRRFRRLELRRLGRWIFGRLEG